MSFAPSTADGKSSRSSSSSNKKQRRSDEEASIERVGADIIQWSILTRLDARSLARCRVVCKSWLSMASVDLLWLPLCCDLFASRAHLPLSLLRKQLQQPLSPLKAYQAVLEDTQRTTLFPTDMCGRTWEIGVKPSCGPYWYYLDPTTRGEPPLVRFFNCDGSLTAGPKDPIWGGQESSWRFVLGEDKDSSTQYVKINYWPMFTIFRLGDGRWRLENKWATYTMQPDLYLGSGIPVCNEAAPLCTGCSFPRSKNAVMPLAKPQPVQSFLNQVLASGKA